jgi:RimJ/RimL family protein N-acetyltransferase
MKAQLVLPQGARALALATFPSVVELRSARTLLRAWRDDDLPAWVAMNADPEVRRYFSSVQTETEALAEAGRARANLARRGWGMWALEIPGQLPFAGMVGLNVPSFEAPFMPVVEMGWRLPRAAWGQGWASEAAAAAAAFGFDVLGLDELVAFTTLSNQPSRRVMTRLGMQHDPAEDFDHPTVPEGHPFRLHTLYRLPRSRFLRR